MALRDSMLLLGVLLIASVRAAPALPPTEVIQPGSQPPEIVDGLALAQPDLLALLPSSSGDAAACVNCHASGGPSDIQIHGGWRGSMMAHASRDPLMWSALAIAEQDYPGAGDTCIRCHVTKGWIEGRSVPSDGSALLDDDADGVTCHLCHRLANPDGSEVTILGAQAPDFAAFGSACATGDANAGVGCDAGTGIPCSGGAAACVSAAFTGNAMISLFQDAATPEDISRLGPYADAQAGPFHNWLQSSFQRDAALCGTCHDVSNPITGDLAPAHGRLVAPLPAGAFSGVPDGPVADKAGFRNPPYAYGVEQRTYSEWVASGYASTLVSSFDALPAELQVEGGALAQVAAAAAPHAGDYADGTPRGFTCQSCHLRPIAAVGCFRTFNQRSDLPSHDLTGANTFAPRAILYLDDATLHGTSRLRLGGGLDAYARDAITNAIARSEASLRSAASLELTEPASVLANSVRVVNLTGHKLFTGYPEGRRMWLNVKWIGAGETLLREDGAYGALAVAEDLDGDGETPDTVQTLLDPEHTQIWNAEGGISKEWATRLIDVLGAAPSTPLAFDRATGAVTATLADAAAAPLAAPVTPSFHLALNDVVVRDNRIPPWQMEFSHALERNALPVPPNQYLPAGTSPGNGAVYLHYDDVALDPPVGALRAEVTLYYQTASWEYVQFLWKANAQDNAFLANVGDDLLEAWLATGESEPVVMATISVPEPEAAPLAALVALALRSVASGRASRRREVR